MNETQAQRLIDQFARTRPALLALAEVLSPAVRIDPPLLRAARLAARPPLDAGVEADLWFSPLIQRRGVDGVVFLPAVRALLWQRLAQDRTRLASAWAVVEQVHRDLTPALRLEEQLVWLALASEDAAALEAAAQGHVNPLLTALLEHRRDGLARWLAQALARLPPAVRDSAALWQARIAAGRLERDPGLLIGEPPVSLFDYDLGFLLEGLPMVSLGGHVEGDTLVLGPPGPLSSFRVEVPDSWPLLVGIATAPDTASVDTVVASDGSRTICCPTVIQSRYLWNLKRQFFQVPKHRRFPGHFNPESFNQPRALFIGVGGTGHEILARLKDKVWASAGAIPDTIQFRLIDTDAEDYRRNRSARLDGSDDRAVIGGNEYLQLQDDPPGSFYRRTEEVAQNRRASPEIVLWYRADLFLEKLPYAAFNLVHGAGQHRQFARMGLFLNKQRITSMLRHAMEKCGSGAGELPIWIVGSVAGGVGAGLFMDLALLVRLVSDEMGVRRRIIGAAVLPDVYQDVGIDSARAYAVLRELERFQAPMPNGYLGRIAQADTRFSVAYDSSSTVNLQGMLFDNLVFYNRECRSEDDRKSYFSEVADGLNLLLDPAAGDQIFREWINAKEGFATSFNTQRVYIPIRIYERQFVLKAALAFANGLLPRDPRSQSLLVGAVDDRKQDAQQIVGTELPGLLQELSRPESEQQRDALSAQMDPAFIVRDMLGFNNPDGIFRRPVGDDLKRFAQRLCDNLVGDIPTARDVRENFEDSRQRVLNEVANRRRNYEGDGSVSFKGAMDTIRPLVVEHMTSSIDASVRSYLARQSITDQALGRTLRVLAELDLMLAGVRKTLDLLVASDRSAIEEAKHIERAMLGELETLKKKFLGWKGQLANVELEYLNAVDRVTRWYQQEGLVALLRELIQAGQGHVKGWIEGLRGWQQAIQRVVEQATDEDSELAQRLESQCRVRSASMGLSNTADMDGYREWLRGKCLLNPETARPIIDDLMQRLVWMPGNRPQELMLDNWPEHGAVAANAFPGLLLGFLRSAISTRVSELEGMRNYLRWLRDEKGVPPGKLADRLRSITSQFLDNRAFSERRRLLLLYGDNWDQERDGNNAFDDIHNALAADARNAVKLIHNVTDVSGVTLFKDRNVLAVLMVDNQIPYQELGVFTNMRNAYLEARSQARSEWRTDTYHLFRCDQEAWGIERRQMQMSRQRDFPLIPGRFTRLLDNPERVELFCTALATGVIRRHARPAGTDIHVCGAVDTDDPRALIFLSDPEDENDPRDLLRALVTFVMDQKDRRRNRTGNLDAGTVIRWIEAAVARTGQTRSDLVTAFRQQNPQLFELHLNENRPERIIDRDGFIALIMQHYLAL